MIKKVKKLHSNAKIKEEKLEKIVKFKDFINYDKRIGKMIIAGVEGTGKTLLLTRIAIGKILHGLEDCWKSYDEVDFYNSLGMDLSKNYEHLCFTNYRVNCEGTEQPFDESYLVNPYKLGLFDENFDTDFFPPYSLFCITEGYNFLNAYLYDLFRESVKAWLKTCRQAKYDMVVDCHAFEDICTIFRRLTNRFIYLEDFVEDVYDGHGVIVGHKLHVIEFNRKRDADKFESSSKVVNGKKYTLLIDKCMHENFDTDYCKYLHLVGRKMQDFFIQHFKDIVDVDQIKEMLESFGTISPEGYFKTKRSETKKNAGEKVSKVESSDEDEDISEFYFDGG